MRRIKNGKVASVKTSTQPRRTKRSQVSPRKAKGTRVKTVKKASTLKLKALFIAGIALLITSSAYLWYSQTVLSFDTPHIPVETPVEQASEPRHLAIESAGIDVSIQPALIKDGIWQTSQTSATHLFTSARPSEAGNIIIYAHNKKNLFAELDRVKVGDRIAVTTETGSSFTYVVKDIKTVKPSAIEEVLPSPTEVLTLYTCTGLLDSQRLVVKAYPA